MPFKKDIRKPVNVMQVLDYATTQVPLYLAQNEIFKVGLNKQQLFEEMIDNDGLLDLEGLLTENI